MSAVSRIEYTFNADSCGDDETAGAFEAWAQASADWPGAAVEDQAARDEVIAALSGLSTYQIACRSASLDASEREANRDSGWAIAADVRDAIERGDCDDCEIDLCAADADEAAEACADAERSARTGYVAPTDYTEWLVLTITRPASEMRAGLVERYYWPRGGW